MSDLHLEPRHLALVQEILQRHVPGRRVWAFGSRTHGQQLRRYSDLDLAIEGGLVRSIAMSLADDFDESLLPIKVDVLALDDIDPSFRGRIEKDFILLSQAEPLGSGKNGGPPR